jgi:hypothetical protein
MGLLGGVDSPGPSFTRLLRETPLLRFGWTLGEAARANALPLAAKLHQAHSAVMDYPPCHRKMERAAIISDVPFRDFVPHPLPI